ncbi:MmcQ/YjbR family DNA-binding protein [Dietzia psychralcaliphila]|uniref:Cytoplasmic protein n=1 Tax=Dietzia psychralcaliphila TaxID=139021 RepID=A0AAD0JPD6_9ACTN|nr:MmcQ/YjbR family DNA-binding protein [Dietzia psychralcaliphila]AWH95210.1 cytoplasmic protein [Dietzia psychralcaliphila]
MNGRELQRCAAMRARELPATTLEFPFGRDVDVYKVRGKVFMLHTEVEDERRVVLKASPSDSLALRDAHEDITPGYHMNKRHWISLHPGGTLSPDMVEELVTESYRLVVAGLPIAQRPVEPHAFGRGQR